MSLKKLIIYILVSCFNINLFAQVVEELTPAEKKQLTRVTEPFTMYKGFLRAGLSTIYNSDGKLFDENNKRQAFENSISANTLVNFALFQYGITDKLEAELTIPYVVGQINNSYIVEIPFNSSIEYVNYTINYSGWLDPTLNLRYQLLNDPIRNIGLIIGPAIGFPLGKKDLTEYNSETDYKQPVAKGEWSLGAELRFRKISYPFSYEVGVLYQKFLGADKILTPNEPAIDVVSGDEFLVRPAVNFHLNEWILLTHYFDLYYAFKDSIDGVALYGTHNDEFNQFTVRYYPGLSFQIKNFRLEQSIMLPLAGRVMPAGLAFYFRTQYVF